MGSVDTAGSEEASGSNPAPAPHWLCGLGGKKSDFSTSFLIWKMETHSV